MIGIIIGIGVGFSVSLQPSSTTSNNQKPSTIQEAKPVPQINTVIIHKNNNNNINPIIRQVFLNNSTHINSPYIKEYSMPNGTWPNSILVAKNGIVWTVGTKSHILISFDPKQGKILSSYPIIASGEKVNKTNPQFNQGFQMVWSIVEGNDGSIWFPQGASDPLLRFDPHTKEFQVIHSISAAPMQMKVDHRTGNIWFTTFSGGTFGVIQKIVGIRDGANHNNSLNNSVNSANPDPQYKVTEINLGNESYPSGIFLQGNSIWVTETLNHNKIVEFKPIVNTNGMVVNVTKVLEIPPSSLPSSLHSNQKKQLFITPTDLIVFANGTRPSSIWLTEHGTSFVTEYRMDSHNVTRLPTSSSPRHYTTLPYWMAEPADHKGFWFNEHEGNRIAFFNTTAMTLLEYEIPTRDPHNGFIANALTLAADPNDNHKVWFTEFNYDKIGMLDTKPSIPFDINSSANKVITLSSRSNNTTQKDASPVAATMKVDVTNKKPLNSSSFINDNSNNVKHNHTLIFLNTSSSMNPLGRFGNMTAKFYPTSIIDLSKYESKEEKVQSNLILQRNDSIPIPPGNYTLGISATNGIVTKSTFKYLSVK